MLRVWRPLQQGAGPGVLAQPGGGGGRGGAGPSPRPLCLSPRPPRLTHRLPCPLHPTAHLRLPQVWHSVPDQCLMISFFTYFLLITYGTVGSVVDPHLFDADPNEYQDSVFLVDADPDPTFHPGIQIPTSKKAQPWKSAKIVSYFIHFGLTSANRCGSGSDRLKITS